MALGRKGVEIQQIVNTKIVDAAICQKLKGKMNDQEECLVRMTEDPENPDIAKLELMNYQSPGKRKQQQF